MKNPFLYDLAKSTPAVKKPSGTVQLAYEKVFPVVAGAKRGHGAGRSEKGGIREPHWHPDAWEFDYCISGKARMSVVGPNNEWREFKVESGQIVFVPQGYFHYFENIGKEDLRFLIVFNNSTKEGATISASPCPLVAHPTRCWPRPSACRRQTSSRSPSCTRRSSSRGGGRAARAH
jgi:oxalate decarboxylase